jgi:DNA repair protein RadA/Sms
MALGVIINYSLPVLYLSAEEQLPQIKARAERLKITGNRLLRFIDMRKGSADLGAVLRKYKFGLLILDSLRAITESDEGAIAVCKIVKEFATMQHAPAMISQHVTKGDEIAGLMALQHEVDATLTFFPDADRVDPDSGEAPRVMETQKNRNGKAFVSVEFLMTKRGLVLNTNPDDEDEDDDDSDDSSASD